MSANRIGKRKCQIAVFFLDFFRIFRQCAFENVEIKAFFLAFVFCVLLQEFTAYGNGFVNRKSGYRSERCFYLFLGPVVGQTVIFFLGSPLGTDCTGVD